MFSRFDHEKTASTAFLLILVITAVVYWPGLRGAFLLDDYQNLKSLQDIEPPLSMGQALEYVRSGVAGQFGRGLSLLTFVVQYQAWPSNPWAFKCVNLLLHLANGCLLFVLFLRITAAAGVAANHGRLASLFAAGAWLLHPMQVSTTLYVVQRMTELAALFTLAGLLAYARGRELLAEGRHRGYFWVSAGVGLGGILATLSKESGVLLVVYALALEYTLFHRLRSYSHWQRWKILFLFLPLMLLLGYFAWNFQSVILPGYRLREFNLTERVLTETRVLLDYLDLTLFPRPGALGLFHDDYPVSRGFLAPPQTLVAIFALAALVATAWFARKREPVYSFGVLWFFGGHLLESTVIPLELYFEHRNYLPMAGVMFAVAVYGARMWYSLSGRFMRAVLGGAVLFWLGIVSWVTWNETRLWGDPARQARVWAEGHPRSLRAQEQMGNLWAIEGNYQEAAKVFARMAQGELHYAAGYISWLRAGCYDSAVELPDINRSVMSLATARFSKAPAPALEQMVISRERKECDRLPYRDLLALFQALLRNPEFADDHQKLWGLLGRLQAADGLVEPALESWDRAYALMPNAQTALLQARLLASAGRYRDASDYLTKARTVSGRGADSSRIRQEIGELEGIIGRRTR